MPGPIHRRCAAPTRSASPSDGSEAPRRSPTACSRSTALSATPVIRVLVGGLDHPEGVCWDPEAGVLWAGGEAGQLYRVELDERRAAEVARAPGFVLGVAV